MIDPILSFGPFALCVFAQGEILSPPEMRTNLRFLKIHVVVLFTKMWVLTILSYVGALLAFVFLTLSIGILH